MKRILVYVLLFCSSLLAASDGSSILGLKINIIKAGCPSAHCYIDTDGNTQQYIVYAGLIDDTPFNVCLVYCKGNDQDDNSSYLVARYPTYGDLSYCIPSANIHWGTFRGSAGLNSSNEPVGHSEGKMPEQPQSPKITKPNSRPSITSDSAQVKPFKQGPSWKVVAGAAVAGVGLAAGGYCLYKRSQASEKSSCLNK